LDFGSSSSSASSLVSTSWVNKMGANLSVLLAPGQSLGLPFPLSAYPVLLLCCSGGLRRIIYAFGLGYGACMLTGGLATLSQAPSSPWSTSACCLYAAYGSRLVFFLLRRQCSKEYNDSKHGRELNSRMDKTPLPVKASVTFFVSLTQTATVYALQPVAFASQFSTAGWAGLVLGTMGLVLETVADEEKLAAKKLQPDEPIMSGTYRIVRHPNYLGEILFWAGIAGSSLSVSTSWLQRFQGCCGPFFMIWVMLGAAKRLDKTGAETKYKDNPQYEKYMAETPSLWLRLLA